MTGPTPPNPETLKAPSPTLFKPQRARLTGFTVILEASVLVRSALRDVLLWSGHFAMFRPAWSAEIIREIHNALTSQFDTSHERADYIVSQILAASPEAAVSGHEALLPAMTNSPERRHVLAAAIMCKAQVIVTNRTIDFPEDTCASYHVEALSPDDFLCDLLDLDADSMIEVLSAICAGRTMPQKTMADILLEIADCGCPVFATTIKKTIESIYGPLSTESAELSD
jgi:hypothetical protein